MSARATKAATKSGSGTHPAVIAHRRKMDSISATTIPALEALNARLDRAIEKAQDDDGDDEQPEDDGLPESEGEASPQATTKP